MKKTYRKNWRIYGFEFLSIFIAVISAFALNNWNNNRRDRNSENKILTEIANGLEKDLVDLKLNMSGHKDGLVACNYFRTLFSGQKINSDSILFNYFNLTRDYISIQNVAGYESLKSKGLELIKNDSLRLQIISLYEYDYNTLRKLEEDYSEMQFHQNYFREINDELAPIFQFDSKQRITGVSSPVNFEENQKKKVLLYLWKIEVNRNFILQYYSEIEKKIDQVHENILNEIKER